MCATVYAVFDRAHIIQQCMYVCTCFSGRLINMRRYKEARTVCVGTLYIYIYIRAHVIQ